MQIFANLVYIAQLNIMIIMNMGHNAPLLWGKKPPRLIPAAIWLLQNINITNITLMFLCF